MFTCLTVDHPGTTFRIEYTPSAALAQYEVIVDEPYNRFVGVVRLYNLAVVKRLRDALTDAIVATEVGAAGDAACQEIAAVAAPADPHDQRD